MSIPLHKYLFNCFTQPFKRESYFDYNEHIFFVIHAKGYSQYTPVNTISKETLDQLFYLLNSRISNRKFLSYYIPSNENIFTDGNKYFYTFTELTFYVLPQIEQYFWLEKQSSESQIDGTRVTRYSFEDLRVAFSKENSPLYIFNKKE